MTMRFTRKTGSLGNLNQQPAQLVQLHPEGMKGSSVRTAPTIPANWLNVFRVSQVETFGQN
jgi:hypothetical protein